MSIIYSAIFSPYDDLKEPTIITPGWEYICFTDQELTSNTWNIVKCDLLPEGPQRTARYYKIMYHHCLFSHLWNDKSIWIDASFIIDCNLDEFWNKNFKNGFSAPQHPLRDCVYLEAEACLKNKRDDENIINRQIQRYREMGIPKNNGMVATGVLMRDMRDSVIDFCEHWWAEVCHNSVRDQIAYGRIAFERPDVVNKFFWDYRHNDDLIFTTHLHKRKTLGLIDKRPRKKKRRRFKF